MCGDLQLYSNFKNYKVLKAGHAATSRPTKCPSLYSPNVATAFKCYCDIEGRTRPCYSMSHSTTPRCRTRHHSAADQTSIHSHRSQIASIGCSIRSHTTSAPHPLELGCRTRHQVLLPHEPSSRRRQYSKVSNRRRHGSTVHQDADDIISCRRKLPLEPCFTSHTARSQPYHVAYDIPTQVVSGILLPNTCETTSSANFVPVNTPNPWIQLSHTTLSSIHTQVHKSQTNSCK